MISDHLFKMEQGDSAEGEKPIWDIGKAIAKTIKIPFLKGILKVCSIDLLIEYTSDTSVENISNNIIINNIAWIIVPNLFDTNNNGIS